MNESLKTKLLSNIILSTKREPLMFDGRRNVFSRLVSLAVLAAAATGLVMMLIVKLRGLL